MKFPLAIAFDLDGTLAPRGQGVPYPVAQKLRSLLEKGAFLAFISGSSLEDSLFPRLKSSFLSHIPPSFLPRLLLFGDGGAAVAQVQYKHGFHLTLPEKSRGYFAKYSLEEEELKNLPALEEKLNEFLLSWPEEASQPFVERKKECYWLFPLEVHSREGIARARQAQQILEKEGLSTHLNLWGGYLEVKGELLPKHLQALRPLNLSKPRFGVRRYHSRCTQLLLKPIRSSRLRQALLEKLPKWLEELSFPPLDLIPAGRTAIDILRQGCSKYTAFQHFLHFFSLPSAFYIGDEFLKGNDAPLLRHPKARLISVSPTQETHPRLFWQGGGPKGLLQWLESLSF